MLNNKLKVILTKIEKIMTKLCEGMYEREEAIKLIFLTSMAGESSFMLGPPGVAKSLIARRMQYAFKDAKYFEYLMHRFSTPDELFGPISIQDLKENNLLIRQYENYLPGANIGFLDEIWKAGSSIQNTLLTILNEGIFKNGKDIVYTNLFSVVTASNELPEENQGLEALWDRFLLRLEVQSIESTEKWEEMILSAQDLTNPFESWKSEELLSLEEVEICRKKLTNISLQPEVFSFLRLFRKELDQYNTAREENTEKIIYLSDRRTKKIIKMLRMSALLNQREKVNLMDCFLIPYLLWNVPGDQQHIKGIVGECVSFSSYQTMRTQEGLKKAVSTVEDEIKREMVSVVNVERREIYDNTYYQFYFRPKNDGVYYYVKIDELEMERIPIYSYNNNRYVQQGRRERLVKQDNQYFSLFDSQFRGRSNTQKRKPVMFSMETIQESVPIGKPLHQSIISDWDKRINKIQSDISLEMEECRSYFDNENSNLESHRFIDPEYAKYAKSSFNQTLSSLEDLKISLDKATDQYMTHQRSFDLSSLDEDLSSLDEEVSAFDEEVSAFDEEVSSLDEEVSAFDVELLSLDEEVSSFDEE